MGASGLACRQTLLLLAGQAVGITGLQSMLGGLLGGVLFGVSQGVDLLADRVVVIGDDTFELRACLDKEFVLHALIKKGNLLAVALSK